MAVEEGEEEEEEEEEGSTTFLRVVWLSTKLKGMMEMSSAANSHFYT